MTLALVFGAALLTGGCRSRNIPEGTLVVALDSMPQNLDPRFSTDAASSRIGKLVFRSLTLSDDRQQPIPDLAVDWQLEDPLTIVFRLRPDAVFQDGSPVTADDVRATYESILDPATASPKREQLAFLQSIEALDARTVRFRLKEIYAPLFEATTIGILPHAAMKAAATNLIGSGPFRIAAIEPGHEVRLEASPGHQGLREIRFRVIPDDTVRALEVKKHTIHLVENAIDPDHLGWLEENANVCVRRTPGITFQYLGMNLRDEHLRHRRVRRAIALAVDRDAIVTHLLNGYARPATGLLAPNHWAYEPNVTRYSYDPVAAQRLLDEAGFRDPDGDGPKVRFRLSYKTTTLDSRRRIAEALQSKLGEIGIGLDIQTYEWGTFYDDIRSGNFQLYGLAWVGVSDPDIFYNILSSAMTPPRGDNRGAYANPEIDRLTLLGRRTFDPLERQRIYGEIQKIAAEDLPFIPLWWTDTVVVQDRRLCGFVPAPDGDLLSLRTAWWNERAPARLETEGRRAGPCGCESSS